MLRGFAGRYPTLVSAFTGYGIMFVGDGTVQLTIEQRSGDSQFDWVRNSTSSVFQAVSSGFMGRWWQYLDRALPGTSIRKLAVNQVVLSCTLTPAYMVWSGVVEAPLKGAIVDWTALATRLRTEFPTLIPTSFCFWLPFHTISFTFVPAHLRVAFITSVSVAWGGYLSFVSHGRRTGSSEEN